MKIPALLVLLAATYVTSEECSTSSDCAPNICALRPVQKEVKGEPGLKYWQNQWVCTQKNATENTTLVQDAICKPENNLEYRWDVENMTFLNVVDCLEDCMLRADCHGVQLGFEGEGTDKDKTLACTQLDGVVVADYSSAQAGDTCYLKPGYRYEIKH